MFRCWYVWHCYCIKSCNIHRDQIGLWDNIDHRKSYHSTL